MPKTNDVRKVGRRRWLLLAGALIASTGAAATAQTVSSVRNTNWVALGNAAFERGELDEAAAHYGRAIASFNDPVAYYDRGNVELRQSKDDLAEADFRSAMRLRPGFAQAIAALAELRRRHGQLDVAVELYRRACALDQREARYHLGLAGALQAQGHADEAAVEYERVLVLMPSSVPALTNLAAIRSARSPVERGAQHQPRPSPTAP